MAKVVLTYDLSDQDEESALELALKGKDCALALYSVGEKLRSLCKHGDSDMIDVHKFRDEYWDIVDSYVPNLKEMLS